MNDYTSPAVNLCHICKTYKITFNPRLFYENALTGDCTCTFCMAELLSDLLAERDAALARKDAALRMAVEALEESRTVLRRLRAINSWGPLVDPRELDNWWGEWGNPDTHSDEVLADIRAALAALEEGK